MSLLIQHGYGKSDKLDNLLGCPGIGGVIASPANEHPTNLKELGNKVADSKGTFLIDPQSYYYSTKPQGVAKWHEDNNLFFERLTWAPNPADIAEWIDSVGKLNQETPGTSLKISPAPLQTRLMDYWAPLTIQLARAGISVWGGEETLVSVAIEDSALDEWGEVEEWLNTITTLDVSGFYLLVSRAGGSYPPKPWAGNRLVNLLRLIFVLSELNEYKVIWGFADLTGLLGLAVGAQHIGSGWSYRLRQFDSDKWTVSSKGGRQPTPRFLVSSLFSPLLHDTEASLLLKRQLEGSGSEVFDFKVEHNLNTGYLESLNRANAQITHLQRLGLLVNDIESLSSVSEKVTDLLGDLERAIKLFETLQREGVQLDRQHGFYIKNLYEALHTFADLENI